MKEIQSEILIIGAGDGGTAREILKHSCVNNITLVEIDQLVIDACKEHLPEIASSFNNSKLEVLIADGIEYVKKSKNNLYDLIIVDCALNYAQSIQYY